MLRLLLDRRVLETEALGGTTGVVLMVLVGATNVSEVAQGARVTESAIVCKVLPALLVVLVFNREVGA